MWLKSTCSWRESEFVVEPHSRSTVPLTTDYARLERDRDPLDVELRQLELLLDTRHDPLAQIDRIAGGLAVGAAE